MGERIKARRELRGWSIRYAADRAGVSHTTWSRVESGDIATNRYTISDYAAALECSVKDLTGQPYTQADELLEAGAIYSDRAWKAMMAHPLTEPADTEPLPQGALEAEATLIRDLYAKCDYAGVLGRAVGAIAPLHAAARNGHARDAMLLMVPVYGCVMGSLLNLGRAAEALLAADRSAEAAQELDDAVALGVATANRARVSAYSGAYSPARTICDRADDHLQHHLAAPDALAVSGFLHLARAHHSAGLRDMATAEAHLAEAAELAEHTGETEAWDLAWGPRNVALWQMALQLDTHRPDEAMQTAASIQVAGLPAVRQVYYHIDRARGLAELGHIDKAIRALLIAERTGKQHTRSSTAARETARSLLTRQRQRLASSPLAGLCERMGVD
ncbi:MAG TPA: helix-turn-helix transcriptional regulator [Micromonosporaceae bacterium]|nr:helix-turn-helix transcriptional regulator [Micromonosporaceae bacterium]